MFRHKLTEGDDALLNEDVVQEDNAEQSSKEQKKDIRKDSDVSENMDSLPDDEFDFDFKEIVSTQILEVLSCPLSLQVYVIKIQISLQANI